MAELVPCTTDCLVVPKTSSGFRRKWSLRVNRLSVCSGPRGRGPEQLDSLPVPGYRSEQVELLPEPEEVWGRGCGGGGGPN